MKKLFLISSIFYLSIVNAQNKKISIEADVNYFHHFVYPTINNFNHGFSLLVHNKINKMKISTGISYNTKNFTTNFSDSDYLNKIERKVSYFNFPIILLSYQFFQNQNFSLDIVNGLLFNADIYNKNVIYYDNSPTKTYRLKGASDFGITYRLGLNLSKKINDSFNLNLQPFIDYKFKLNYQDYSRGNIEYSGYDNRFSFGLKVGLEYFF